MNNQARTGATAPGQSPRYRQVSIGHPQVQFSEADGILRMQAVEPLAPLPARPPALPILIFTRAVGMRGQARCPWYWGVRWAFDRFVFLPCRWK